MKSAFLNASGDSHYRVGNSTLAIPRPKKNITLASSWTGILLCFSRRRAFRNQYMVLAIWLACGTGASGTRAQAVPRPSSTPSKLHRSRRKKGAYLPTSNTLQNDSTLALHSEAAHQFNHQKATRGSDLLLRACKEKKKNLMNR